MIRRLRSDTGGSVAIEMALTLPALIVLTMAIMQLGIAFLANAGLTNGVEEAARYSTIYPYPTDDQIRDKVRSAVYGLNTAQLSTATVTHGTSNSQAYVEVTATYPVQFDFIFYRSPTMTLSYTRRAYLL